MRWEFSAVAESLAKGLRGVSRADVAELEVADVCVASGRSCCSSSLHRSYTSCMATTETRGQRDAERLLRRRNELEQQTDETARRIRDSFRQNIAKLDQDADLNPDAKRRRTEELRQDAQGRMSELSGRYRADRDELRDDAARSAFQTTGSDVVCMERRREPCGNDHGSAARAGGTRACAHRRRPSQLVAAIARHAYRSGWHDVARQGAPAEVLDMLDELEARPGSREQRRSLFRWSL